jgi:hypothetical protein
LKALSLWQPWATLIALQAKRFETRSWYTDFRGPLLIHAAKSKDGMELCMKYPYLDVLNQAGCIVNGRPSLPMGCALCTVELVGCFRTTGAGIGYHIDGGIGERPEPAPYERHFGDYSAGRYAWQLENVRVFNAPVPMKGMQGLFEVDYDALIGVAK